MTEAQQVALTAAFTHWFKGNESACLCAAMLTEIAHTWDDHVDGDKVVPAGETDRAFSLAMLELPSNAFYRSARDQLDPAIMMTFLSWSAATTMERSPGPGDREKCYMLRAGLYQLFHLIAALTGGVAWARVVGPDIYRAYGETLEDFDA